MCILGRDGTVACVDTGADAIDLFDGEPTIVAMLVDSRSLWYAHDAVPDSLSIVSPYHCPRDQDRLWIPSLCPFPARNLTTPLRFWSDTTR